MFSEKNENFEEKKFRILLAYNTLRPPMSDHKKFGPAVWPAIGNIYMNVYCLVITREPLELPISLEF